MSIYTRCAEAVVELRGDPPKDQGGIFTELDVVSESLLDGEALSRTHLRDANNICGQLYRNRQLCRYGPVMLPDGTEDYARIAAKIAYADAEDGPDFWETPNGKFPKLLIGDDKIARPGRRIQTKRNDLEQWVEQDVSERSRNDSLRPSVPDTSEESVLQERIRDLEQQVIERDEKIAQLTNTEEFIRKTVEDAVEERLSLRRHR